MQCGLQYSVKRNLLQLILKKNGEVFVIGGSRKGGLGLGDEVQTVQKLTKIDKLEHIVKIVSGSEFNVALDAKGKMWSWGLNNYGQLGNTSMLTNSQPKMIHIPGNRVVTDVSCGENFCLASTSEGDVLSWGCGCYGQLGQGTKQDLGAPKLMSLNFKVKDISCGEAHAA